MKRKSTDNETSKSLRTSFGDTSTPGTVPKPQAGTTRESALLIDDSSEPEEQENKTFTQASFSRGPSIKPKSISRHSARSASSLVKDKTKESSLPRKKRKTSLNANEQWWIDDDEVIHFEDDDVLEEVDQEFIDISDDEPTRSCPVCNRDLEFLEDEETPQHHINTCLNDYEADNMRSVPPSKHSGPSTASTPKRPPPFSAASSKAGPNAFSVLMSSHKENNAWKEAALDSVRVKDQIGKVNPLNPRKSDEGRRLAPFYKVMQGMPVAVDAFRYGQIPGVEAYFLTHAHSDHYTNLSASWTNGPIYCSETTAKLIKHMLRVKPQWVHPLPMDTPTVIPGTEVTVTLIEANHCPGSVLYLFSGKQTIDAGDSTFKSPYIGSSRIFNYLHCGDYRASPAHVLHPAVKGVKLDLIYLDTTYLNPKYCFPPQKQVIDACAALARKEIFGFDVVTPENDKPSGSGGLSTWLKPTNGPVKEGMNIPGRNLQKGNGKADRALIVVGTYSIGKERIVKAVAKALGSKVYADPRKMAILSLQDDPELHALLTKDPIEACVHVVPLQHVNSDKIGDYLSDKRWKDVYSRVIGFRPTGWTYASPAGSDTFPPISQMITKQQAQTFGSVSLTPMRNSTHRHTLYGVPYSEHSSFYELTCFALSTKWVKMIATVNVGSESGRGKMNKWFETWGIERRRRMDKCEGLDEDGVVPFRCIDYW